MRFPLVVLLLALAIVVTACGQGTVSPVTGAQTAATPTAAANAASPTAAAAASPAAATTPGSGSTASVAACPTDGANSLTGAGATFPAPLYTRWFDDYKKLCNISVNYQAIGSGGGIKQITEKTVDFGASDGILTEAQFKGAPGVMMIPMTAGSVAVVANLEGLQSGQLKLTPETLSGIFLGTITKWDDPKIAADNADLKLPSTAITVVHRSDGSGTTNIFTSYLSAVSPDWKSNVGAANSVQWPVGLGGEGNAGVAGLVKQRTGSIGYVEQAYAVQTKLPWAALKNQSGAFIEPTLDATTAAMEGVTIPDNTQVMIVNSSNPKAYPIAGMTWILAYKEQSDAAKAQTLVHLLWWNLHEGQKISPELGYAALAPQAIAKAEAEVKQITVNGQPVLK